MDTTTPTTPASATPTSATPPSTSSATISSASASSTATPTAIGGAVTPATIAGRAFISAHGRVLDQRRAAAAFDGEPTEAVVYAVLAYRNADGGFGHGLEPDTRDPNSQPLYAEVALEAVHSVGARLPVDVAASLCDHLATVAAPSGTPALPIMLPSFADHPRASHWLDVTGFPPGLNPTASIVGHLHAAKTTHPWLDEATTWCLDQIDDGGLDGADAHALRCVATLLAHIPDRAVADRLADDLFERLTTAAMFQALPTPDEYGLTPLHFAPTPGSPWRTRFDDHQIAAHLDVLAADQQADGGWPIRWEPPTEASVWEWRGMVTFEALATLAAYGR